ncbi:hypothetical protein LTS15_001544 [Exophiala xenobiotica]|nr:hypothetical protein LTS15_001544 [Exophiala xenobiotica]
MSRSLMDHPQDPCQILSNWIRGLPLQNLSPSSRSSPNADGGPDDHRFYVSYTSDAKGKDTMHLFKSVIFTCKKTSRSHLAILRIRAFSPPKRPAVFKMGLFDNGKHDTCSTPKSFVAGMPFTLIDLQNSIADTL